MGTVFSHIVQKRLSRENENVATEALSYVLGYSKAARNGMMKLLRGIVPELPDLRFQTQQTEGKSRPDMCGYDRANPRVYIENKFWAALTENQPVDYIEQLSKYTQPKTTVLLVVVPEAREQMLWRVLCRKLRDAGISVEKQDAGNGIVASVSTGKGPALALTSWARLISAFELEAANDQAAQSDLLQLRALCKAADTDVPISAQEVSDVRTPSFILQLSSIVQEATEKAISAESLYKGRFKPQANWKRIGQYARFSDEQGVGVWLGIHFGLWKKYGETPLWAVFSGIDWGRAREARALLEPWATQNGVFTASHPTDEFQYDSFVVAINIEFGEERDQVTNAIAGRLKEMAGVLSVLRSNPAVQPNNE